MAPLMGLEVIGSSKKYPAPRGTFPELVRRGLNVVGCADGVARGGGMGIVLLREMRWRKDSLSRREMLGRRVEVAGRGGSIGDCVAFE